MTYVPSYNLAYKAFSVVEKLLKILLHNLYRFCHKFLGRVCFKFILCFQAFLVVMISSNYSYKILYIPYLAVLIVGRKRISRGTTMIHETRSPSFLRKTGKLVENRYKSLEKKKWFMLTQNRPEILLYLKRSGRKKNN